MSPRRRDISLADPPGTSTLVPFFPVRLVHGHHTNIIAYYIRGNLGVEHEANLLSSQKEAWQIFVARINFNDFG